MYLAKKNSKNLNLFTFYRSFKYGERREERYDKDLKDRVY